MKNNDDWLKNQKTYPSMKAVSTKKAASKTASQQKKASPVEKQNHSDKEKEAKRHAKVTRNILAMAPKAPPEAKAAYESKQEAERLGVDDGSEGGSELPEPLIAEPHYLVDELGDIIDEERASEDEPQPNLSKWQRMVEEQYQQHLWSGVAWSKSVDWGTIKRTSMAGQRIIFARREASSWFLKANNNFIYLGNHSARLAKEDVDTMLRTMLADRLPKKMLTPSQRPHVAGSVIDGGSEDPTLSIGVWSGKSYSLPGNPSPRLYRDFMWDVNLWQKPSYRDEQAKADFGAFLPFLEYAIPGEQERNVLLDWLAWSLQNESQKPGWAIFLFSEEKGTGKSTITTVAEALFGAANTANVEGVDKLIARFNSQTLSKKLVIAEEVKITSNSAAGNSLKELITGSNTTVDVKFQPMQNLELRNCFLLTTNHRPIWLEGGERRYYIIHMNHNGHNQGEDYETFVPLVEAVMEQIKDPVKLAGLYAALLARKPSEDFNPRSLNYAKLASPIMRELQLDSQPESEALLEELLNLYCVSIIPSADQKALTNYLKFKSEQALRHTLIRLGWQDTRLRWGGKQRRVYIRKGTLAEKGRVQSELMSSDLESAVEGGYVWWPIESNIKRSWDRLLNERLKPTGKKDEEYSAVSQGQGNETGEEGPYLNSGGVESYWTWKHSKFDKKGLNHIKIEQAGTLQADQAEDTGDDPDF